MVRIRLRRMGARNRPFYRIVVADARKPRDGAYIEKLGHYDPLKQPHEIIIEKEKAIDWLKKGAQPTEKVLNLLKQTDVWEEFSSWKSSRQSAKKKAGSEKAVEEAPVEESESTDSVPESATE